MSKEIGSVIVAASIAMIVVCTLGLTGHLGLHSVSAGSLTTSLFSGNLPAFIVSIMGLCGAASLPLVSGVSLGFAVLTLMTGSVVGVRGLKA